MIIFELNINNDNLIVQNLYIEKINNILVSDYYKLYYFISNIFNNQFSNVSIGYNKIDSKNTYIINLLDYESINNQLMLKKGSLLYDYLIDEVIEKVESTDIKEEIEIHLRNLVTEAIKDKTLDYDINFMLDLEKIINNYIVFNIDLSIEKYIEIIKKLIVNLRNKNLKKQILIFVNYKIFNNILDDLENIIIFKFNTDKFPNILISEKIENIEKNILVNQLKLNWPCEIKDNKINEIIDNFFKEISYQKNIKTSDYMLYIGYYILNQTLSLNMTYEYIGDCNKIPIIYKKFMDSLQKL